MASQTSQWRVIGVAMIVNMLMVGGIYSAFGIFVLPVSRELGLSRATMNTGLILINLGNAVLAPPIGRMLDRVPEKLVMMVSSVILGLSFASLALVHALWFNIIVLAVALPGSSLAAGTLTVVTLLARRFSAHRARAMALAAVGMHMGGILVAPTLALLVEKHGWRVALLALAVAMPVLVILLALAIPARAAEAAPAAGEATPASPSATPIPIWTLLRMPQLWTIGLAGGLGLAVSQTLLASLVPLGRQAGLAPMQAASLIWALSVSSIAGTLLLSVLSDRIDRLNLMGLFFVVGALVNVALLFSHGYPQLLGCAVLMGASNGLLSPLISAVVADRFGAASFGAARGFNVLMLAISGMVTIRFAGEVFDRTGGYSLVFETFIGVQLVAVALVVATRLTPTSRLQPAAVQAS